MVLSRALRSDDFDCPKVASALCILGRLDGPTLAFSTLDLESGQEQAVASIEINPAVFYDWALSPDGSLVAVINLDNLRIVSLKGGETRQLLDGDRKIEMEYLAWTADGQGVIVNSIGGLLRDFGLLYVGLDGHTEIVWQKENEWPVTPVPSPDGRYLAYGMMIQDSNAWMIENF